MGAEGGMWKRAMTAVGEKFKKQSPIEKAQADILAAKQGIEMLDQQRKSLEASLKRATAIIEGHNAAKGEASARKLDAVLTQAYKSLAVAVERAGLKAEGKDFNSLLVYINENKAQLTQEAGAARQRQATLNQEADSLEGIAKAVQEKPEEATA